MNPLGPESSSSTAEAAHEGRSRRRDWRRDRRWLWLLLLLLLFAPTLRWAWYARSAVEGIGTSVPVSDGDRAGWDGDGRGTPATKGGGILDTADSGFWDKVLPLLLDGLPPKGDLDGQSYVDIGPASGGNKFAPVGGFAYSPGNHGGDGGNPLISLVSNSGPDGPLTGPPSFNFSPFSPGGGTPVGNSNPNNQGNGNGNGKGNGNGNGKGKGNSDNSNSCNNGSKDGQNQQGQNTGNKNGDCSHDNNQQTASNGDGGDGLGGNAGNGANGNGGGGQGANGSGSGGSVLFGNGGDGSNGNGGGNGLNGNGGDGGDGGGIQINFLGGGTGHDHCIYAINPDGTCQNQPPDGPSGGGPKTGGPTINTHDPLDGPVLVPEPASLALFGGALLGFAALRRRPQHRQAPARR